MKIGDKVELQVTIDVRLVVYHVIISEIKLNGISGTYKLSDSNYCSLPGHFPWSVIQSIRKAK